MAGPLLKSDEDWHLIPNSDGHLHLVDVNRIEDIEPAFNPWTDVIFLLFTRSNQEEGQIIGLNNGVHLANSFFNPAHPTRVIIHGWTSDGDAPAYNYLRQQYLNLGNFNVIVVNWGAGAITPNYVLAQSRVDDVGNVVANFIDFLNMYTGIPFSSVSVIGHSLGAHVAGFSGKHVIRGRLPTIVALDPALPLFSIANPAGRVSTGDAYYVESIQTNVGLLGFDAPIGHSTFYPNFGRLQPGCGPDVTGFCSHVRAVEFLAESITNPYAFYGTHCSGWPAIQILQCPSVGVSMPMGGEPLANGAFGEYYMPTNAASPFGQGWRP